MESSSTTTTKKECYQHDRKTPRVQLINVIYIDHLRGGVHPLVSAPSPSPADLPRVPEVVLADAPGQV